MRKLLYIANARIPTERAHGLQMNKMCEAFAAAGNEVTMLAPTRRNPISADPYSFYKTSKTYRIEYLPCPDLVRFGSVGFVLSSWIFAWIAAKEAAKREWDWLYTRDARTLWFLSWRVKGRVFGWEIHDTHQYKWWAKRVLAACSGVVTTNRALAKLFTDYAGGTLRTLTAPNGMSLDEFPDRSKEELRRELGLESDAKIVLYAGHLYGWKGVDTLMAAARALPEYVFACIGGTEKDIAEFKERHRDMGNIRVLGHQPHHRVALFLRAADLLTLPNTAKDRFSTLYTSPIKLFEYIASGTPVVASDLPSVREVVADDEVYFAVPDDPESLRGAIKRALTQTDEARVKALKAYEKAKTLTWDKRAGRIVDFFAYTS